MLEFVCLARAITCCRARAKYTNSNISMCYSMGIQKQTRIQTLEVLPSTSQIYKPIAITHMFVKVVVAFVCYLFTAFFYVFCSRLSFPDTFRENNPKEIQKDVQMASQLIPFYEKMPKTSQRASEQTHETFQMTPSGKH